jgi:type I restriction enzyme S subunit
MSAQRLTPLLLGRCPEEWGRPFIEEVTELLTNGFVGASLPHQTENNETGVRYLQGFNVRPNRVELDRTTWVTRDFDAKNQKSHLREGDVLVVQSGHIGTAAVVPKEAAGSNCHAVIICRFRSNVVNAQFAAQYLNSEIGQARLRGLHVGSSMPHINTSELGRFRIPLPELSEQNRIADVLTIWDTAIHKTEQLIAAKRRRLDALRDHLFSHRSRESTVLKRLSEILVERRETSDGSAPVYSVSVRRGVVNQVEHLGRSFSAATTSHYNLVRPGDIVYTKSPTGDFPLGIVKQSTVQHPVIVSPLYVVCVPKTREVGTLVDFFFESPRNAKNYLTPLSQKGAKNTISISTNQFLSGHIVLPACEAEISRVASHVSDARHELSLLEAAGMTLSTQKRGLMQKLFTGEWRLPLRKEEAV